MHVVRGFGNKGSILRVFRGYHQVFSVTMSANKVTCLMYLAWEILSLPTEADVPC